MTNPLERICTLVFVFLSFLVAVSPAQGTKGTGPRFDVADFNKKFEIVDWLVRYDEVAWKTSDVLATEDKAEIAKLGQEWFCLQDQAKLWHAVYGKLADGKFQIVFHYTFDSSAKISRSADKLDQNLLNAYANALSTARTKLKASLSDQSPIFNQYIRNEADGTFSIWMLPAFQPDGTAVYGGEAYYSTDATGAKILKEESYFQPNFRGFKTTPAREIWVDYHEIDKPTLGSIFFVWYYKSYFTKIFLNNTHSTSTVIDSGKGNYMWVHVDKDDDKKKAVLDH